MMAANKSCKDLAVFIPARAWMTSEISILLFDLMKSDNLSAASLFPS